MSAGWAASSLHANTASYTKRRTKSNVDRQAEFVRFELPACLSAFFQRSDFLVMLAAELPSPRSGMALVQRGMDVAASIKSSRLLSVSRRALRYLSDSQSLRT